DDLGNRDWRYGVEREWLEDMVHYWRTAYDWRAQERVINRLANFRVMIDGVPRTLHARAEPQSERRPAAIAARPDAGGRGSGRLRHPSEGSHARAPVGRGRRHQPPALEPDAARWSLRVRGAAWRACRRAPSFFPVTSAGRCVARRSTKTLNELR